MSESTSEYLEPRAGTPLPRDPRPRRTALLAGAGVLGVALVGGAAWGAWWWSADGPQAAEALPASSIGYVGLTLDPSGSQKVEALRTLQRFPAIAEELDLVGSPGDIDLREALGTAFLETAPCDLTYAEHLEPWLGERLGLAALPDEDQPQPLAAIEVTDEGAAEEALAELVACGTSEAAVPGAAFEVRDGWALLAPDQDVLDAALGALDEGTLADDEDFVAWTGLAGDTGVVTMYAAPSAADYLAEALGPFDDQLGGAGFGGVDDTPDPDDQVAEALADFAGAAAQLRFIDGAAELELAAGVPDADRMSGGGEVADLLGSLPEDTVLAAGAALGDVDDLADDVPGGFFDPGFLDPGFLDLPALLGDAVALAIGPGFALDEVLASSSTDLPLTLVTTGTRAAADEAASGVGAGLGALLGTEPSVSGEDGRVVLGLSPTWAQEVASGGALREAEAYRGALPEADGAAALLFVDLDAVLDVVAASLPDLGEEAEEVVDNIEPLTALGVSGRLDDDMVRVLLRLTTD